MRTKVIQNSRYYKYSWVPWHFMFFSIFPYILVGVPALFDDVFEMNRRRLSHGSFGRRWMGAGVGDNLKNLKRMARNFDSFAQLLFGYSVCDRNERICITTALEWIQWKQ